MIDRYKKVVATFTPKRTDDLRPHALPWIGYTGMWYRAWVIEEGENEYAGQWAWMPVDYKACGTVFGWTPECDLTFADQPEAGE